MNKSLRNKIIITVFTLLLTLTFMNIKISANDYNPAIKSQDLNISAKGAAAIDSTTGQILYEKNGNQQVPMASVSKLITAYIVLERIHNNQLSWDTKIKISPEIARLSNNPQYTNVPLIQGHSYTVKQLFESSLICSANASAMALGNYISGNSTNFGKLMGTTLHKLGIRNYKLYNACGLSNGLLGPGLTNNRISTQAENTISPMDLIKFARILLIKYPDIIQTTQMTNINWNGKNYSNTDLLLGKSLPFRIDGLKTGTSNTAGGNFVGTGSNGNTRMITVVLGANQGQQFYQTKQILDGITEYLTPETISNNSIPIHSINIPCGVNDQSKLTLSKNNIFWIPTNEKLVTKFHKIGSKYKTPLAPIKKNSVYGIVKVSTNKSELSFLQKNDNEIKVVFTKDNNLDINEIIFGILEIVLLIWLSLYLISKFKNINRH